MIKGRTFKDWARRSTIALALVGSAAILSGQQGRAVVTAGFVDPMAVLSGRSPGERAAGAMTQTKPRISRPTAATERVLTAVRTRPITQPDDPQGEVALLPVERAPLIEEQPDLVSSEDVGGELVDAVFRPDGAGLFDPALFPITGGGVVPPPPAVVPLPVAGVPEPTTWLMMIAGFLAIGLGIRRRGATMSPSDRPRPA